MDHDLKRYAGIGARKLPTRLYPTCKRIAAGLEREGYMLCSGGAMGADTAFAHGVPRPQAKRIFDAQAEMSPKAFELAGKYHPAWHRVRGYARRLLARNCLVILGADLCSPVEFVVCWTPVAKVVGGTVHALRIADAYDIPTYNIADATQLQKLFRDRLPTPCKPAIT